MTTPLTFTLTCREAVGGGPDDVGALQPTTVHLTATTTKDDKGSPVGEAPFNPSIPTGVFFAVLENGAGDSFVVGQDYEVTITPIEPQFKVEGFALDAAATAG